MKGSELITKLQEIEQEHGDLTVRLWADHEQCSMSASHCSIGYIEDLEEYIAETLDEDALYNYPNAVKFCELCAC